MSIWTSEVWEFVRQLPVEFKTCDAYLFECEAGRRHLEVIDIRAKIRKQLQILRDMGYLKSRSPWWIRIK